MPWGWLAAGFYLASAASGISRLAIRYRQYRHLLAELQEHIAALNPATKPATSRAVAARLLVDAAEKRASDAAEKARQLELQLKLSDAARQRTETLLSEAEKQVSQIKNAFAARLSHDLRTPLASIKAYIEMLIDGEARDPNARDEFYEIIQNETNRLGRLIDEILCSSPSQNACATVAIATDSTRKKVPAKISECAAAESDKPPR